MKVRFIHLFFQIGKYNAKPLEWWERRIHEEQMGQCQKNVAHVDKWYNAT